MPETPQQLYERVQREGLRMPPVEEWESWPFDGELRPRALQPPEERERRGSARSRRTAGGADTATSVRSGATSVGC